MGTVPKLKNVNLGTGPIFTFGFNGNWKNLLNLLAKIKNKTNSKLKRFFQRKKDSLQMASKQQLEIFIVNIVKIVLKVLKIGGILDIMERK